MKKILLGLSILLLTPGVVVASEPAPTDRERKEHHAAEQTTLSNNLRLFLQHSTALSQAKTNRDDAQTSIDTEQPKVDKLKTSIKTTLAAKSTELAASRKRLAVFQASPQRDSNLDAIAALRKQIEAAEKEIADGFETIGEQEPEDGWWGAFGFKKQPKAVQQPATLPALHTEHTPALKPSTPIEAALRSDDEPTPDITSEPSAPQDDPALLTDEL